MKKKYLWAVLFAISLMPGAVAEDVKPAALTEDQQLEVLRQNWNTARTQYRDALKAKREHVAKEVKTLQHAISAEKNQSVREKLMAEMKKRSVDYEDLDDKIRVISAGDVVQLSNNRVIAFITNQ